LGLFAKGDLLSLLMWQTCWAFLPAMPGSYYRNGQDKIGLKSLIGMARIMHPGEGGSID